jgi:hypothetical protein
LRIATGTRTRTILLAQQAAANNELNQPGKIGLLDYERENDDATWNDWPGPDGRQHGAPAH